MDIKLNRLITPQVLTSEVASHLWNPFHTINLPTEAVVTEPRFVIPRQARVFRTDLYVVEGNVINYHELHKLRGAAFRGTAYEKHVYLIEVWGDFGDDGHVSWCLIGWKFIETSDLDNSAEPVEVIRFTGEDYDVYIKARRAG